MTELKTCPFCVGDARIVQSISGLYPGYMRVECKKCDIRTDYYENEKEAVRRWNKRKEIK